MKKQKDQSIKELKKTLKQKLLKQLDETDYTDEEFDKILRQLDELYSFKEEKSKVDLNTVIQASSIIAAALIPIVGGIILRKKKD